METEKTRRIRTARIHPAIGIARLGNSPEEFFVGPELPGVFDYPDGGFRDAENNLKRQGARFRIYGYDEDGRIVREITEADATIEWRVHLRNTKAVGRKFAGVLHPNAEQRNKWWFEHGHPESDLILEPYSHPKVKYVSHRHSKVCLRCDGFMGVKFKKKLELGRLLYEKGTGRLVVLGGRGFAGTPYPNRYSVADDPSDELSFANHDGWFDDTSDGVVTAEVSLKNGRSIFVTPSWVIVAPPKFAPELQTIVTLYDTLYQAAVDRGLTADPFANGRFLPSFNRDIFPILRRAGEMRWVFAQSAVGHTFTVGPGTAEEREHIFRQFRMPSGYPKEPGTGTGRMPFVWSDLYREPALNGTVTRLQYKMLAAWADGNFENDWDGTPPPLSYQITAPGLDRAALEACVGAAFYPGIEVSWKMRDVFQYLEPFRLDPESLAPGDVTQQMSLPWQSDFVDCAYEDPYVWWPAQRPIDVLNLKDPGYVRWARPFEGESTRNDMDPQEMVDRAYRLGHILRSGDDFIETGRVDLTNGEVEVFNKKLFKSSKR